MSSSQPIITFLNLASSWLRNTVELLQLISVVLNQGDGDAASARWQCPTCLMWSAEPEWKVAVAGGSIPACIKEIWKTLCIQEPTLASDLSCMALHAPPGNRGTQNRSTWWCVAAWRFICMFPVLLQVDLAPGWTASCTSASRRNMYGWPGRGCSRTQHSCLH